MARILITGGTGSFGSAFVKKYHKEHELTVFSRDENKQFEMRAKYPDIRYEIGDVRDRARVNEVMRGQDLVFHAAALKQVPSCEAYPFEAVKTNILGTEHVLSAARANNAKLVFLSTDKAVHPINAMGISKAMAEKLAIASGAVVTRYGNVMRTRGSIIPIWEQAKKDGKPLKLTDPKMTRFLLSLDDSIGLVMYAMEHGKPGEIFVKKAPACTMWSLAKAISDDIEVIGTRHGEKTHETLISVEEMVRTEDLGDYYRVTPDLRDMNYGTHEPPDTESTRPFTSENTLRLSVDKVRELL